MSLLNRLGGDAPGLEVRTGFKSTKTAGIGIPYGRRWSANALIQASLDPRIEHIFACPEPSWSDAQLVFGIKLGGTRAFVAVHEDDDTPPDGVEYICLSRSQIMREPIAGAARSVWAERDRKVPASDRVAILIRLHSTRITLGELISHFGPTSSNVVANVLRLACDGEVLIDLTIGLTPETYVWRPSDSRLASIRGEDSSFRI